MRWVLKQSIKTTKHRDSGTETARVLPRLLANWGPLVIKPLLTNSFSSYVLQRTPSMEEFGGLNLKVVIALAVAWTLTALCLIKGVKWIGRIALFTATVPYVIICILFVRSVTLPGAQVGLDYYLFKPDFSTILNYQTWQRAATHVCYSLAIGFGGLLSLSSFNPRDHNCFRDALIITCADGFMSVFGGTAVFSVLGFMSTKLNVELKDVVKGGTGLAFIVYPEAMNRMPLPWLWSFLFFAMLFILGISSQFGLAEVTSTALTDQFIRLRPYKAHIVCLVSLFSFGVGLLLCTGSGIYYFQLFNSYSASFALMLLIGLELILVMYIYKYSNYREDIRSMLGYPKNWFTAIIGPSGSYIGFIWMVVAPLQAFIICGFVLAEVISSDDSYSGYSFPLWSKSIVWFFSSLSIVIFILVGLINAIKCRRRGDSWKSLFQVQLDWPDRDDVSRQLGTSHTSLDEDAVAYRRYCSAVAPKDEKPNLNIVWVGEEKEQTKL
uniref:Sodium-and chloride-dependent glycine transporter 2 n=1 Tax=Steinernema glaseri TaxID=37863 RepID=A0A1I8ATY5_9BILA